MPNCPHCQRSIGATDGRFNDHGWSPPGGRSTTCPGSGQPVGVVLDAGC